MMRAPNFEGGRDWRRFCKRLNIVRPAGVSVYLVACNTSSSRWRRVVGLWREDYAELRLLWVMGAGCRIPAGHRSWKSILMTWLHNFAVCQWIGSTRAFHVLAG